MFLREYLLMSTSPQAVLTPPPPFVPLEVYAAWLRLPRGIAVKWPKHFHPFWAVGSDSDISAPGALLH
jgi:hypothetical protein